MPRADGVRGVWNHNLPSGLQGEPVDLMEHLQCHLWRREEEQEQEGHKATCPWAGVSGSGGKGGVWHQEVPLSRLPLWCIRSITP